MFFGFRVFGLLLCRFLVWKPFVGFTREPAKKVGVGFLRPQARSLVSRSCSAGRCEDDKKLLEDVKSFMTGLRARNHQRIASSGPGTASVSLHCSGYVSLAWKAF